MSDDNEGRRPEAICYPGAGGRDGALDGRARKVFGYAAGGVPWMPTTYSDEGDHADLAALLVEDAEGVQPVDLPLGAPYEL